MLVDRDKAREACAKEVDRYIKQLMPGLNERHDGALTCLTRLEKSIRQLTLEECRVETPRTDALKIPSEALLLLGIKGVPEKIVEAILTLGDHARQLESQNAALSARVADLSKQTARLEKARGELVDFFRHEGFHAFGDDGDYHNWPTEKTAIEAMRECMQLRRLIADQKENKEVYEHDAGLVESLSAQVAELRKDAERYRFLKPLYHSIDFEYGDSSEGPTPSIIFAIPPGTKWSGNLDASIDDAAKESGNL